MSNNNNNNRSNDDGRLSDIEAVSNSGLTRICTLLRSLTFENLHAQVAKESGILDPILVIALGARLFRLSEAIWMDVRSSLDRIYVHSGKTFAELGDAVQPWSSAVSHRSSNNSNNDLASLEAKNPSATVISKVCVALKQKGSSMSVRDCEVLLGDVEKGLVKEKFGGRLADLLLQSPDQLLVYDKGSKVALARSLNDWNDLVRKRLEACGGVSLMAVLINDPDVSQQIRESHGGFQKLLNRLPSFEIFGEPGGKESVRLRDGTSVPPPVQQPVPNVASASVRASEANGVLTPEKIALREWVVKFLKDHGGSCRVSSIFSAHQSKAHEVRKEYKSVSRMITASDDLFEQRMVDNHNHVFLRGSVRYDDAPLLKSVVEGEAKRSGDERLFGTIVTVTGQRVFIRETSQPADCPVDQFYSISLSRFRPEDRDKIKPGSKISFSLTSLPRNPNPVGDDPVVTSASMTSSGNQNDNNHYRLTSGPGASCDVITDAREGSVICSRLLLEETLVALDCEGVDLGRPNGKLCLVQIASGSSVWLFDVQQCPALLAEGVLKDLLESPKIVKAVHDCRGDAAALYEHNIALCGVFDTQAGLSLIDSRSRQPSLQHLLRRTSGKEHPQKARAPHLSDRKFWQERPLSKEAKSYAAADVELLYEAALILISQFPSPITREKARRISNARVKSAQSRVFRYEQLDGDREQALHFFGEYASSNCKSDVTRTNCMPQQMNEFQAVLDALPSPISRELEEAFPTAEDDLVDVVMDLRRPVVLTRSNGRPIRLGRCIVTEDDIQAVVDACGNLTDANRACVGSSLHRCSVIFEPSTGSMVGLTLRMARVVQGIAEVLRDLLKERKSLLLVGPPGRGKTTLLRDVARLLASENEDFDRRVMVVDTNNEIAGEGVEPHTAIGNARRMKVGERENQYRTMLEAVQNHTPEALVIDEIGTRMEVTEAVSIQQRGVQLIATTHGRTLVDIIQNPQLRNLVGGINTVILSAMEREAEGAVNKTRSERRMKASFDVCIELMGLHKWRVHHNVNEAVDVILRGEVGECEIRELNPITGVLSVFPEPFPNQFDEIDHNLVRDDLGGL